MQWLHALYEKPAPYDWIIFLFLLCIVTVPVYLLATLIAWRYVVEVQDAGKPADVTNYR